MDSARSTSTPTVTSADDTTGATGPTPRERSSSMRPASSSRRVPRATSETASRGTAIMPTNAHSSAMIPPSVSAPYGMPLIASKATFPLSAEP